MLNNKVSRHDAVNYHFWYIILFHGQVSKYLQVETKVYLQSHPKICKWSTKYLNVHNMNYIYFNVNVSEDG